jgi:hypothetical protein
MKKYETIRGQVTRGETFAKLNECLIECQELAAVMAHLHNTEDGRKDRLVAQGWLGIAELLKRMQTQVIKLAMSKLQ